MTAVADPCPPVKTATTYRAAWYLILGLIGLDYFSTLAYQPSIAFEAAGLLAPLATAFIVLLTLLGALPVYAYIAGHSPPGQGSMAIIEHVIHGWKGKILILVLLGFAATNFVFTRTLSTADATVHIVNNPSWQPTIDSLARAGLEARSAYHSSFWQTIWSYWDRQLVITLVLLVLYCLFIPIFWRGFTKRLVQVAAVLVSSYLFLTLIILLSGFVFLLRHSERYDIWLANIRTGNWQFEAPTWADVNAWSIVKVCLWLLPKMALGLSGFEMCMVVMPIVRGRPGGDDTQPAGQIRNTRKLMLTSALMMSGFLLGSALVTTLLMAPESLRAGGAGHERALASLAHGEALAGDSSARDMNPLFGPTFGTIYDISTILVLCLAGASVSLGMRSLLPQFLLRFGMELQWANATGLIFLIFNAINLVITMAFKASVDAQRSAYAISVLSLMACGGFATTMHLFRSRVWWRMLLAIPFAVIFLVFLGMAVGLVWHHPASVVISGLFIITVIVSSLLSRWWRSKEFRFDCFEFDNEESRLRWDTLRFLHYSILVPHRPGGRHARKEKELKIRQRHRISDEVPIVFLETIADNPSEFVQKPLVSVKEDDGVYVIRVTRCASVAHVIAAIGIEFSKVGEPPEIHFGWSDESALWAMLHFLLFGEGNIPWLVHDLLKRHESDAAKRPRVIVG
jgi:hypothetical protein